MSCTCKSLLGVKKETTNHPGHTNEQSLCISRCSTVHTPLKLSSQAVQVTCRTARFAVILFLTPALQSRAPASSTALSSTDNTKINSAHTCTHKIVYNSEIVVTHLVLISDPLSAVLEQLDPWPKSFPLSQLVLRIVGVAFQSNDSFWVRHQR